MEEIRKKIQILVGKLKGKRPVDRIRCRWKKNIKLSVKEIWWECVERIHLTHDND
jgi:hypothetical protein